VQAQCHSPDAAVGQGDAANTLTSERGGGIFLIHLASGLRHCACTCLRHCACTCSGPAHGSRCVATCYNIHRQPSGRLAMVYLAVLLVMLSLWMARRRLQPCAANHAAAAGVAH
jgi:hypothetical protein